jgi:hypothetical protein
MTETRKERIYNLLYEYKDNCTKNSFTNKNESKRLSKINTILNVVSIIITTGSATVVGITTKESQEQEESTWSRIFQVVSVSLLFVSAGMSSVQQFFNFEKQAEKCRILSIRFLALSGNIRKFIVLQDEEDEIKDLSEYIEWVSEEYQKLMSESAMSDIEQINPSIKGSIDDTFLAKEQLTAIQENFTKPPINEFNIQDTSDNVSIKQKPDTVVNESIAYEMKRYGVSSYN